MIKTRIAKRYARALFELAQEAECIEQIGGEMAAIATLYQTEATVRNGLTSPVTSREEKGEVLNVLIEAVNADAMLGNFLRVLLEARKLAIIPQIQGVYAAMADEATGKLRGVASAPTKLDDEALGRLAAALSKALGKEVILEADEDPALLGGVVARVGNLVFDASVKTQIERMKDSLIKG